MLTTSLRQRGQLVMGSQEPDAAAVVTLGAIFVVLTFLSGFLSDRLHGAYRDAVDRQRQLGSELVTRSSLTASLEEDYESIRWSLADALATPVLVVLAGLAVVGIWLDLCTWRAAHLRWLDYRTLTLGLLALGLFAVASLGFADYWRLRRRLGAAIDKSPVHRLLLAEASITRVWDLKVRLASVSAWLGYNYIELKLAEDSVRDETDLALRESKAKVSAAREAIEAELEREQASVRRELEEAEPQLKNAQRLLAEVAAQPGLESWGRVAGLQAVSGLVEAFNPEQNRCSPGPHSESKIRAWLQAAITAEPWQPRWLNAGAFFAEAQGDTAGAALCYVRAWDLGLQDVESQRISSLLEPGEETDEQVRMGPREPATYRAVFDRRKNAEDWLGAASAAELYLMATFALPVLDIMEQPRADPFAPIMKCIREAIDGLCRDETVLRLGWLLAEEFLKSYKDLAERPRQRQMQQTLNINPDLGTQFDRLNQELVAPTRAAAEAERSDRNDQHFKGLSQLYGVSIKDGIVSVEDRDDSCPLGAAHAYLVPTTAEKSATTRASPPDMNITIKAGDFEARVRPVPFLRTEDARWWVEQFNKAAQAAKKQGP
jgi:hypothetical protein